MTLLNRKSLRKSRTCTPRNTWSGSIQRIPRTAPWYHLTGGFVKRQNRNRSRLIRKVTHRKYNKSKYLNVYKLSVLNKSIIMYIMYMTVYVNYLKSWASRNFSLNLFVVTNSNWEWLMLSPAVAPFLSLAATPADPWWIPLRQWWNHPKNLQGHARWWGCGKGTGDQGDPQQPHKKPSKTCSILFPKYWSTLW